MAMNRFLIVSICAYVIAAKSNLRASSSATYIEKDDSKKSVQEYVTSYGYSFEEHKIHTEDHYILTLWRIPCKLNGNCGLGRKPVLLQHGIFDTGFTYLFQDIHKNLAIMLVNEGYDVWIGNARGSMYSLEHESLDSSNYSSTYWDFSWDELGQYDLPAMISYIKRVTHSPKVSYVCHSQGCTMILVLGCINFTFINENIDRAALFAPAMYAFDQMSIPVDLLRLYSFSAFYEETRVKLLAGQAEFRALSYYIAKVWPEAWATGINFAAGWVSKIHLDLKRLPVLAAHEPGGTSFYDFNHYVQGVYYNDFRKYDFGKAKNMEKYGQSTPPIYNVKNLGKVDIKWYVVYGEKDHLITTKGVHKMLGLLKPGSYQAKMMLDMNHLDVCWADELHKTTFPKVINFLEEARIEQRAEQAFSLTFITIREGLVQSICQRKIIIVG
eukprot:TRINITY_DN1276_c0_g1_i1.p1 TRINITY_DN1276_c0_g1~~TRINITY_DN1276_c0_g1_i1.p1  ORF type:complete len:440 (-),score=23.92 TRINITY_DN1276_c0_g1_i1:868-2187(-)